MQVESCKQVHHNPTEKQHYGESIRRLGCEMEQGNQSHNTKHTAKSHLAVLPVTESLTYCSETIGILYGKSMHLFRAISSSISTSTKDTATEY